MTRTVVPDAAVRPVLTDEQVRRFIEDGFVRLPEVFPRSVADGCREILWRLTGLDPLDRSTWTRPVVRVGGRADRPFQQAAMSPRLRGAYDQLVGPGRWVPRPGLGTFPIRFPHPDDPGDTGWHLDGSYASPKEGDGWPWVNLVSRGRALLMLLLFSDVGPEDAPTRIKVGSHLDVPRFLAPHGDRGISMFTLCRTMEAAGRLDAPERATALATGDAGDVFLCHPFLIHAAQQHQGTEPRFIAQPPLEPTGTLRLADAVSDHSPVELAVRRGLALAGAGLTADA